MTADLTISPTHAVLLIVDMQERLAAAMRAEDRQACERNVLILLELCGRFGIPVVASEQYPKGLGPTLPAIAAALPSAARRFEKVDFACTDAAAFQPVWDELGARQWIVTGMEAHVCVYQTARGLAARGATVHVPVDAIASRTPENRAIGIGLIERAGGIATSTEVVVFDVLRRAGSEDFKALSRLVR